MIAEKTYCLTLDRKTVVEESDPRAAFLLVAKGCNIDDRTAAKFGLTNQETQSDASGEPESNPEGKGPVDDHVDHPVSESEPKKAKAKRAKNTN